MGSSKSKNKVKKDEQTNLTKFNRCLTAQILSYINFKSDYSNITEVLLKIKSKEIYRLYLEQKQKQILVFYKNTDLTSNIVICNFDNKSRKDIEFNLYFPEVLLDNSIAFKIVKPINFHKLNDTEFLLIFNRKLKYSLLDIFLSKNDFQTKSEFIEKDFRNEKDFNSNDFELNINLVYNLELNMEKPLFVFYNKIEISEQKVKKLNEIFKSQDFNENDIVKFEKLNITCFIGYEFYCILTKENYWSFFCLNNYFNYSSLIEIKFDYYLEFYKMNERNTSNILVNKIVTHYLNEFGLFSVIVKENYFDIFYLGKLVLEFSNEKNMFKIDLKKMSKSFDINNSIINLKVENKISYDPNMIKMLIFSKYNNLAPRINVNENSITFDSIIFFSCRVKPISVNNHDKHNRDLSTEMKKENNFHYSLIDLKVTNNKISNSAILFKSEIAMDMIIKNEFYIIIKKTIHYEIEVISIKSLKIVYTYQYQNRFDNDMILNHAIISGEYDDNIFINNAYQVDMVTLQRNNDSKMKNSTDLKWHFQISIKNTKFDIFYI